MSKNVLNIVTTENSDSADILLYGYIGEAYWDDKRNNSDMAFVEELQRLEAKYDRINIRINSPGGSVYHGNAIVNAIMSSKKEIHTYIDGMAASMGFMIWACSKNRHCSVSGIAMAHSPLDGIYGNALEMRECADKLDKFETGLVNTLVTSLEMTEEDVREKYFAPKDTWLDRKEMVESGLINQDDEYTVEIKLPDDIENLTYLDIVNHFKDQKDPGSVSLLQGIKEKLSKTQNKIIKAAASVFFHKPQELDMNHEEFKNSIANGDLNVDEIKAHLATMEAEATPAASTDTVPPSETPAPPAPAKGTDIDAITAAFKKVVEPLQEEISGLKQDIEAVKKAPGAHASIPPIPDDKLPEGVTNGKALAEFQESIKAFGDEHVKFTAL